MFMLAINVFHLFIYLFIFALLPTTVLVLI